MIEFTVYGHPEPQGSMRPFLNRNSGQASMTSDNSKMKPWRQQVAQMAMLERPAITNGPIAIMVKFVFAKPKSAPKARFLPTVKPDIDKLCRAILDSLTGICYRDDAQVVSLAVEKEYGLPERAELKIVEVIQ